MKKIYFPALALTLASLLPGALEAAVVRGSVRDNEKKEPLSFVTVQVIGTSGPGVDVSRGIMSLTDGTYIVAGIPVGDYVVRFTRVGFETFEDSLAVTADTTYVLDVVMVVKPVPVTEIIVEGDRYADIKDVQTGFVALETDRLAELPGVLEADPIRTLQLLPGVQAASDFSSGLYVRGGGPDQTLVMLDNVVVYNPTHAFGFFSSFNSDALDDVNLYKGAYPADYGGRLGAVLDVRSREGNDQQVKGRVGLSTITASLTLDGPVGKGSWMASGRRTYLEPILNALRSPDNEIPDYYFYDLNGKLTYPAAGGKFTVDAYNGDDDLYLDLDQDSRLAFNWGNTLASAGFDRQLSPSVVGKLKLSYSRYSSRTGVEALTTPIVVTNEIRDLSFRGDLSWQPADKHKIDAGFMASSFDVRYYQEFNQETQIDYRQTPNEFDVFAEDTWTPRPPTIVKGGLRTRYIDDGNRLLWEPRLAVSERINDRWRAKLGGGIYHQYLQLVSTEGISATDFYVPIDATADVGRSWQVVGGVEYNPVADYTTSIEAYYTDLSNLVALDNNVPAGNDPTTAEEVFYTGGTGYAVGTELFLRKNIGAITGWVGYTLGWTRRTFSEINGGETYPPKYDRRHDLNIVAQYRRGPWHFGSAFIYATGQAFTPASSRYLLRNPATGVRDGVLLPADRNSSRLLPYHRLDLSVIRDFSMFGLDANWEIQIFNVYNRRNEWFIQYDTNNDIIDATVVRMLPIIPSLGVNFRF